MTASWRTVRVFISSTFKDMQAERDHLVRFVFPKLREELLARRIHLVDVDLRWGVTSEQDSLQVCKEIIDECRPRFLCTLGGRYGWTPPGREESITAAEVRYGVLEGRLQLWHKQMDQRGVRAWQCQTLNAGDWAEVEPLHCHFACWLDREGLGTVIKTARSGELAGVGRLGVSGKTACTWKGPDGKLQYCSNHRYCAKPPDMTQLFVEYQKPYEERDYGQIASTAESAELRTCS